MNMEARNNAGYTITDSIHVGEMEFVIGERSAAPSPFVTWACTDGSNYFWGHYLDNRLDTIQDLLNRAGQELEFQRHLQERAAEAKKKLDAPSPRHPAKAPWGEISNCSEISPGVFSVATPAQVGIMVRGDLVDTALSSEAQKYGFSFNGYFCFAGRDDSYVALRDLLDKGLYQEHIRQFYSPGVYDIEKIDAALQQERPDYWKARQAALSGKTPEPKKPQKERER